MEKTGIEKSLGGVTRRAGPASRLRNLGAALMGLALVACQSATDLSQGLSPNAGVSPSSMDGLGEAEIRAPSTLVVDAASGRVLFAENPDSLRYPASLTKMMTLYLAFEAVESGRFTPDSLLTVSVNAASKPPAKLGLAPGATIRLGDAVQAAAVKSANDVATVIAENIGGSEEGFANMMTAKARQLGMRRSRFVNPSGLPDPRQISTARDLATLALALRSRFPRFVPIFAEPDFDYQGRHMVSTNKLLGKVPGVDGMKTGYIRDSGFHLVVSAQRGAKRIIVVVMGGETGRARDARAAALVEQYLQ